MQESPKISIIIPVYKVEAYLPRCLDSLAAQTYGNLEILLVDDGSPDGCGRICDEYAMRDERFRVIHKENEGVARARNDGLRAMTGDLVSFADSDDYLAEDAYETLLRIQAESGADAVVGGCRTMLEAEDGTLKPQERSVNQVPPGSGKEYIVQDGTEAMRHVLLSGSAVWNRLFSRAVFDGIFFPEDRINDDEVTALHAYERCKSVAFTDRDTYFYRIRANSITTSAFSLRKVDCFYNARDNLEFIRKVRPQLVECAEFKYSKTLLYCIVNLRRMKGARTAEEEENRRAVLQDLRAVLHAKETRAMVRRSSYLSLPMKALAYLL